MRALFTTERLQDYAGSELVILEAAEHFRSRGWKCLVAANSLGRPLTDDLSRAGVGWTSNISEINAFHFDIVWIQHLTAPLLRYVMERGSRERTLFVFAHLSPSTHFENTVTRHEDILSDVVLANSAETADRLRELALPSERISIFHNAAPAVFQKPDRAHLSSPQRILVVSNELSEELRGAMRLVRRRIDVKHIGSGSGQTRVSPEHLAQADVVVTIGKTVQYALAGRVPVYVYNGFGGPGYLNEENFEVAARHNFSGRCCRTRRTADQIAAEIFDQYGEACAFSASLDGNRLDRFDLDRYLEQLAALPAGLNEARALALAKERGYLERERATAEVVRTRYQLVHRLHLRLYGAGVVPWLFRAASRYQRNSQSL